MSDQNEKPAFELLQKNLEALAKALMPNEFQPLLDAGYSVEDVCHYATTHKLFAALSETGEHIEHLVSHHEDMPAAELNVAIWKYLAAREDNLRKAYELMGGKAVEAAQSAVPILAEATKTYEDLRKKINDREELEKDLDHLV